MFLFHWISVLLISVTFYTYLANIVFLCNLAFNHTQYSALYQQEGDWKYVDPKLSPSIRSCAAQT